MAAILPGTLSAPQLIANCTNALTRLRDALADCEEQNAFLKAHTSADLQGMGMDPATAQGLLNAMADANGLAQIQDTGTDPRNPPPPYVYATSQREFTNVQLCLPHLNAGCGDGLRGWV